MMVLHFISAVEGTGKGEATNGSGILLGERKRILDVAREIVWPNLHWTRSLRHREVTGLPSVSWLPDGVSGTTVFCTRPITAGMSDMWGVWYYSAASLDYGRVDNSIIHQTD